MLVRSPSRGKQGILPWPEISVGVLFENSIVCHVFYAMALGLRMLCVWFWGLFCFGLPGPDLFWGWVGLGLVFWTVVLVGTVFGFDWFCLESLILAQDERWRRA